MSFKAITVASVAIATILIINVQEAVGAGARIQSTDRCQYWYAKVDPSAARARAPLVLEKIDIDKLTFGVTQEDAARALEAAECLLKLEGKTSKSIHPFANISLRLDERIPGPKIEVAALYHIAAYYHNNWQHAQAMLLIDHKGKRNTKKSIRQAFRAYRAWLEKVKRIGLEEASKQNLDPLDGTGIRWYGNELKHNTHHLTQENRLRGRHRSPGAQTNDDLSISVFICGKTKLRLAFTLTQR